MYHAVVYYFMKTIHDQNALLIINVEILAKAATYETI